jgi:thioredoxin reductase
VIAGAGPAGLSAALILGRARRKVLVCDHDRPRSWASKAVHAFLTREGIHPRALRALARRELAHYPSVELRTAEVMSAAACDGGFDVTLAGGSRVRSRKLLIATGMRDVLPPIPNIDSYFGKTVFQCPYCDGWECRDMPIAVYGKGKRGFEMVRAMSAWTTDIILCTDGRSGLSPEQLLLTAQNRVPVIEDEIARLEGARGRMKAVVFANGKRIARSALFFDMPAFSQSNLGEALGCKVDRSGRIKRGKYETTDVPGVFIAGNVIDDVQLSIVAAAEGARAAYGINRMLTREDFDRGSWQAAPAKCEGERT